MALRALRFFLDASHPESGLTLDRTNNTLGSAGQTRIASIAATGYAITAFCIGIHYGWLDRRTAVSRIERVLTTIETTLDGKAGFYYHFIDWETGKREWNSELSSIDTALLSKIDLLVTTTGNVNVCDANMLKALKKRAVVCNIGHFDNEIDTAFMRKNWAWEEVKPQVHKIHRTGSGSFDPHNDDYLILLAEGRLVNLGNATGHPSRIMDGSFANQVLAQIFLFEQKFADLSADKKAERLTVEVLPKKLDEEVALEMVKGFGGVVTQLTSKQAEYIGVPQEGPFKPHAYRY